MSGIGRALLVAARPRTLTAGVAPVAVGTAIATYDGHPPRWPLALLALLGAAAIQVGTNYFNDAFDYEHGADTDARLGPPRAAASGLLAPGALKLAGLASFAVALACGIPLVLAGGTFILILGLLSLAFGWAYTGGPFPLAYHGLGELFVLVFFGLGAVGGTYWLHAHTIGVGTLIGGVQNGLFACALLMVNNLRDVEQDRAAHKRTLAVRLSPDAGRALLVIAAAGPFALQAYWLGRGAWLAGILPLVTLPGMARAVWLPMTEAPSPRYNISLAMVAVAHLVFALALGFGLASA